MKKTILMLLAAGLSFGQQIVVPDGTKLRVRLDQQISSATADEGQQVNLSVTEPVKVGDMIVIEEGARVTGTITMAQAKRNMGRAGKLDFSIDRVRCADGEWIPIRYELNKKEGNSHAVSTGVITAGAAVLFWPAAPFFLLRKGKDTTINKGITLEVFTDTNHTMAKLPSVPKLNAAGVLAPAPTQVVAAQTASVTFTSNLTGSEIEVDGAFVGSTPTTLALASGPHAVTIRNGQQVWQRNVQVNPGSTITLDAQLSRAVGVARK